MGLGWHALGTEILATLFKNICLASSRPCAVIVELHHLYWNRSFWSFSRAPEKIWTLAVSRYLLVSCCYFQCMQNRTVQLQSHGDLYIIAFMSHFLQVEWELWTSFYWTLVRRNLQTKRGTLKRIGLVSWCWKIFLRCASQHVAWMKINRIIGMVTTSAHTCTGPHTIKEFFLVFRPTLEESSMTANRDNGVRFMKGTGIWGCSMNIWILNTWKVGIFVWQLTSHDHVGLHVCRMLHMGSS